MGYEERHFSEESMELLHLYLGKKLKIFGKKPCQVIQYVTFLSPNVWRSPTTFETVTFSPSQKGHKELLGGSFFGEEFWELMLGGGLISKILGEMNTPKLGEDEPILTTNGLKPPTRMSRNHVC